MLTLHHNNMSVCAQKVRLVIRAKSLEVTEHHLNLRLGDQLKPDYLALNPNGVVPTLVVDGRPIIESTLICEYLDEAYPAPPLRPGDLVERAIMRRFAAIPDQGLHAACGTLSSAIAFRHQYLARPRAEMEDNIARTPDPARRERKRLTIEMGMAAPFAADAVRAYDGVLGRIEARLGEAGTWLTGDAYSLAEACLTPYLVRLDHLRLGWMWDRRPRLAAWYERIQAQENFTGIADYLDDKYLTLMAEHGPKARPIVEAALAA
ncbi:MAG TPA: glutathione S-transferase family protein [Alphaproteobacteria bacterium]|nr:glutathione S-transferase family protein [Alphaproteobacteria bacterium]